MGVVDSLVPLVGVVVVEAEDSVEDDVTELEGEEVPLVAVEEVVVAVVVGAPPLDVEVVLVVEEGAELAVVLDEVVVELDVEVDIEVVDVGADVVVVVASVVVALVGFVVPEVVVVSEVGGGSDVVVVAEVSLGSVWPVLGEANDVSNRNMVNAEAAAAAPRAREGSPADADLHNDTSPDLSTHDIPGAEAPKGLSDEPRKFLRRPSGSTTSAPSSPRKPPKFVPEGT